MKLMLQLAAFTWAALLFAATPTAAQNDPQGGEHSGKTLSSGIQTNYSVVKQTPEQGREITLYAHFTNTTATAVPGTIHFTLRDAQGTLLLDKQASLTLTPGGETQYSCAASLPAEGIYPVEYTFTDSKGAILREQFEWNTAPINFFYSFGTPHRMTVAMPDSSGKTLFDAEPGKLTLRWTFGNLKFYPYASCQSLGSGWNLTIHPMMDGKPFKTSSWTRTKGYLPVMENRYERDGVTLLLEAAGGEEATITRITLTNRGNTSHEVCLPIMCGDGTFKGPNPGWINRTLPTDHLVASWGAPADQILVQGVGADTYPLDPVKNAQLNMNWTLAPGETKTGWMIRPYNSFERNNDQQKIRTTNWAAAFDRAVSRWEELLSRASRVIVPEPKIEEAYYAGLADIFIMREPVGTEGYITIVPGTSTYRSGPNLFESAIATIATDQAGLHDEADKGYRINWDLQTPEGDWTEPYGWGHTMWGASGYKAWALFEHFANTRDTVFLRERFPQLLANSRWQEKTRALSRQLNADGSRPLTWGLMPPGMGDCGLYNDGSYYGIFTAHNIWAVYADSVAVRAAQILGKNDELKELQQIYNTSKGDLLRAMYDGAIRDEAGKPYLTSVPGKTTGTGSSWGLLATTFPFPLLAPKDSLVTNIINHYVKELSPGGLPIHTGWMADGMWVAITLNDFAETHLLRDESDIANAYLYAVLNHATPFLSWCEERGLYPNTTKLSGDRQHLWTPVAVTRFIRDMLVMEQDNTLHLSRGISRRWLQQGEVGIQHASTRFGDVSYRMHYDPKRRSVVGEITLPEGAKLPVVVHCPLPNGMKISRCSVGQPLADGSGFQIPTAGGTLRFEAKVK